jgi:hypothetical protein
MLAPFWAGHLTGTNRGRLLVRLTQHGQSLDAEATFYDQASGPTLALLAGTVDGLRAELRIVGTRSGAPVSALDGHLVLTFNEGLTQATGTWQTDIGTAGYLLLRPVSRWRLGWWARRRALSVALFVWNALRLLLPALYTLALVAVVVLTLAAKITLPYSVLVLLLLPGIFIFQSRVAMLINTLRLRRVGPVEFEQNAQPPVSVELLGHILQHVEATVRRTMVFFFLDGFLVPRTKMLLAWLGDRHTATREEFAVTAASLGVPQDNLDATMTALTSTGLVAATEGRLTIQPLGQEYLLHVVQGLPAPASPTPAAPIEAPKS